MARTACPRRKVPRHHAGEVLTFGFQAGVFGGQYTLIERTAPGTWTVAGLPPGETGIAAGSAGPYYAKHGGAGRVIAERWANWGTPRTVKFVTRAQWDRMF